MPDQFKTPLSVILDSFSAIVLLVLSQGAVKYFKDEIASKSVLFTAGGIATPADAAMMMQLGADGVFVGSGIFKSGDPAKRAAAIVKAVTFYNDPKVVAEQSRGLGEAMVGINVADIPVPHRLAERGW